MKRILSFLLIAFCAMTSFAKDIRTVVLTVSPQMHCAGCENRITENLRYVKGVKSIKASAEQQTVTVVIDGDKTTADALVKSLKKIGYTATVKSNTATQRADKPVQPKPAAQKSSAKSGAKRGKVDAATGATAVQK